MKRIAWLLAGALSLGVTASAQQFGEAVQVTVVEVPVTVVDSSGKAVRGLTKDDFEVRDDGKRVPIEYFEVLEMSKVAEEAPGTPLPPAATRHFLLMFDLANSAPGTIERAADAAKEFVTKELSPRDLAAVAVYTAESGARMVTSFTTNRRLVQDAIQTLGHPKYFKVADPLMMSAVTPQSDGATTTRPDAGSSLDGAFAEFADDFNRMSQQTHDSEMRNRLRVQFENFGAVARALDRLRGQKQIILLSEGFDARVIQGRENLSPENTRAETDAIMSGEVWRVDPDQRFGTARAANDVSDMAELFRRSDVVLHAIDIKGLRSAVDASTGAGRPSTESLFLMTKPTGGTVFKNANDLGSNFRSMLTQQEVVYVLGVNARTTGKPGKFHELSVKAKAPRGTRVAHRAGYYEPGTKITELEKTLTLAEILITDMPIEDIAVSIAPVTLPGPGGKARVPVAVEIPGSKLLEGVSGNTATANIYLYAFDEQSAVADFIQQRIALDLTRVGDTARASGVRYFGTLRLPPGRYAIKALVRVEESERIGFRRADLQVPAFDTATVLPPVLFAEPENWITLVGPTRGDDYAYPFSAGETMYVPRSAAELAAGTDYTLALFLYRVPLQELQVEPMVITANGASQTPNVTLVGRTSADERGGVKLLFNFKPEGLAAGAHQLRFTVKSNDGTESVVSLPFRIL